MTTEMRDFLQSALQRRWQEGPQVEGLEKSLCKLQVSPEEILEVEAIVKETYPDYWQDIDNTFKELYNKARPDGMVVRRELTMAECLDGLSAMRHYEPLAPQRTPTCYRYVLHLYSGVRRQGDFHTYMEHLQPPDGHSFYVASVDLVLGLLDRKAQSHWLDMAAQGAVYAVLAGPPCESWSVARFRFHLTGEGPKPIRSGHSLHDEIWGLRTMRIRDVCQADVANQLLLFMIDHHSMDVQWIGDLGAPRTSGSEARVPTTEHLDPPHLQIFDFATGHPCSTHLSGFLGSALPKTDGVIGGGKRCGREGPLYIIEPYENQIDTAEST